MSIARPTALIRRAVALPMGLLDRIEAGLDARLDAGFARVDRALDRRISAVTGLSSSISQGLGRSAYSLDRALDQRVIKCDSRTATRSAKSAAAVDTFVTLALGIEDRANAKLNRSLHGFDRATAIGTQAASAAIDASIALTHRSENKISRGFDRVDARATNIGNRVHRRQSKTFNLAHRITARINQRIETDFLKVDARVNAGINHTASALATTVNRTANITTAADTRISNAVTRVDARVDRRLDQATIAAAATVNLVNAKALAFERAMDHGISRVDSRISNGAARGVAAKVALTNRVNSVDSGLTSTLTRIDYRFDKRVAQATYGYVKISEFASNRIAITDVKLDNSVASLDLRVSRGVNTLVAAATGISNFATDHIEDADCALTKTMSRIDSRVEAAIDLVNGQPGRHASQPRTSLPWAATSLTIVLGTLGAATGASVVNANLVPTQVDATVQYDATAAKDAVTQYLSVRDTFQALQASRSRTIQTLEEDIADAQQRASQTFVDGDQVIDIANNYSGVPYARGGTTPSGFDCSGYTSYVFAQMGINLPRVASAQYAWSDKISADDRKPGDLMFWSGRGGIYHVGIYAGNGKMWDSPRPGRRVGKISIWGSPIYGRVPIEAINAPALREVKKKTAELEKLKANPPQLPITIDENLLPAAD